MRDRVFEPIDEEQCLELLNQVEYGRVAVVTVEGGPEIFPVNFAVRGRTVVFVTGSDTIATRASLGRVAFEADHIDPETREGWDVVVRGDGADISDATDSFALLARTYAIVSWVPGQKDHWISILNPHFTGRRLSHRQLQPGTTDQGEPWAGAGEHCA